MKKSTIVRFVFSGVFATIACVGFFTGIAFISSLWWVAWLFLMGRSELTKPLPRTQLWVMILTLIVFIGLIVTLKFLHLPEPNTAIRAIFASAFWILWMWAIYRHWQREKGQADA